MLLSYSVFLILAFVGVLWGVWWGRNAVFFVVKNQNIRLGLPKNAWILAMLGNVLGEVVSDQLDEFPVEQI